MIENTHAILVLAKLNVAANKDLAIENHTYVGSCLPAVRPRRDRLMYHLAYNRARR